MKILCAKSGDVVLRCLDAESMFERCKGLLGRDALPAGEILRINRCGMVHTFGMRFSLDLVFLDKSGCILKIRRNVPPRRIVYGGFRAAAVLEAQAGGFPDISVGETVVFE